MATDTAPTKPTDATEEKLRDALTEIETQLANARSQVADEQTALDGIIEQVASTPGDKRVKAAEKAAVAQSTLHVLTAAVDCLDARRHAAHVALLEHEVERLSDEVAAKKAAALKLRDELLDARRTIHRGGLDQHDPSDDNARLKLGSRVGKLETALQIANREHNQAARMREAALADLAEVDAGAADAWRRSRRGR